MMLVTCCCASLMSSFHWLSFCSPCEYLPTRSHHWSYSLDKGNRLVKWRGEGRGERGEGRGERGEERGERREERGERREEREREERGERKGNKKGGYIRCTCFVVGYLIVDDALN